MNPAFLQLNRLCGLLLLKLSPHSCQSHQTKTKKQHCDRFRDSCCNLTDFDIVQCPRFIRITGAKIILA